MHWGIKKVNYEVLVPQLDKGIFQLNETEAEQYFRWFLDKIPERVTYVSHICAMELGINEERMNCSPDSLLLLWKWFRKRAKTEPVVRTNNGNRFPDSVWKNERQLTLETEYILRDIGMYLGETFRKNNSAIYWTYYTQPRRDFFVNHPLLKGFTDRTFGAPFEASFEPIHMAHVQAVKIISNKSRDSDLLRIYKIWAEKV